MVYSVRMNHLKAVKISKKIKIEAKVLKGGDLLNWCIPVTLSVNGKNGGAVRIPQKFLKKLEWEPGKTEVDVQITEDGSKLVIELSKELKVKAS